MTVKKSKAEIATIDCSLITIQTDSGEFGFQTASQVKVEPLVDTQEAVSLVVKGRLLAQKPSENTLIGNRITLTDNVFNPELALILNGGQIIYDTVDTTKIIGYRPPLSGSGERGEAFTLTAYTAFCFDEACYYIIQQLAKENAPRFKSKHKSFRDLYADYTNGVKYGS